VEYIETAFFGLATIIQGYSGRPEKRPRPDLWSRRGLRRAAGMGAGEPPGNSHHGSRIMKVIRTNIARSPAKIFLNQVAQICHVSADRQADIFATHAFPTFKRSGARNSYTQGGSQNCEAVHRVRVLTDQQFSL